VAELQSVLDDLARLRREVEAIDDPGIGDVLDALKRARTEAEAGLARAQSEAARALSGIGAAPRYSRLR
jgi:hypothetical protein